jgi:hypothetical protein
LTPHWSMWGPWRSDSSSRQPLHKEYM